jgi:DNA-directed RNA polymerase subunit RPC12/RpoP
MEKCPVCKEEKKGKYWCSACKTVFICPLPGCGATISNHDAQECPRCGLLFADYVNQRKMYRQCPKCKKKQGLNEQQCRHCKFWFNCPTCGHKVTSTSALTCPRCGTNLHR